MPPLEADLVDALRQEAHPVVSLVAEEVFMAIELQSGFLHPRSGKVQYHAAFTNVST
jgi:predicted N-acetyltransferase YhbS